MAGYCGLCNTHYDCHFSEHDEECPGTSSRPIEAGSREDFESQLGSQLDILDTETVEQM